MSEGSASERHCVARLCRTAALSILSLLVGCAAVEVAPAAPEARTGRILYANPETLAGILAQEVSAGDYVGEWCRSFPRVRATSARRRRAKRSTRELISAHFSVRTFGVSNDPRAVSRMPAATNTCPLTSASSWTSWCYGGIPACGVRADVNYASVRVPGG